MLIMQLLLLLILLTKVYFIEAVIEDQSKELENENCTRYMIVSQNKSLELDESWLQKGSQSPWNGKLPTKDGTGLVTEILLYDYRWGLYLTGIRRMS